MSSRAILDAMSKGTRDDNRYTPKEATQALIIAEGRFLPPAIWEPACGEGHVSKVLEAAGRSVASSDIRHTGYGLGGVDFLTCTRRVKAIGSNPPFSIAVEFIEQAAKLADYWAFLLKANYWNVQGRYELYNRLPPARIYPLTWRLDFTGQNNPPMDCTWYVWDRARWGERQFQPLPKPCS